MAKDYGNPLPIKVLIVDDEQLVRKGLRMTIDWEQHQMIVVDDASNGSIGWQKFLEHRPQLVITDIVMPEMSGIELAQNIRKVSPDTSILFLSCHRDFNYAKLGIQLNVHDYIVKTDMDDDHIHESLNLIYQKYKEAMINHSDAPPKPKMKSADRTKECINEWLVKQSYSARDFLLERLRSEWKWMLSTSCLIHIYQSTERDCSFEALMKRWEDLSFAYPGQLKLLEFGGNSAFLACSRDLADLVLSKLVELKISERDLEWRQSKPVTSAEGWLEALNRLHRIRQVEQSTRLFSTAHKEDIIQAIDFIDEHLDQDIRAADIAAVIGVSRSYFSTIFKEATGCSIISFIAERKLRRAKELLSVTSIRTEEVAEKIGIQDVKYFSKWFKKQAEVTPGQYRLQTK
ncbi:two-component system response regulator YesN [Fontibacillus phaseoli]|uniref:Two-component system response regulator YesN n=1 Tax=Fontibacillus phaseoli TaxID=1416533 RepID=A0A369BPC2_9BACL|nr:response regulator [Fontibacillus phaseoli]RCX23469.1 two-component system response regulator YesN [Fontibacillus phaseoli]